AVDRAQNRSGARARDLYGRISRQGSVGRSPPDAAGLRHPESGGGAAGGRGPCWRAVEHGVRRPGRVMPKLVAALLVAAVGAASAHLQSPSPISSLQTTAEASGFKSTSSYEDVVRFMKAVDAASPNVYYSVYGKTLKGRDMPLAVVGPGWRNARA